MSEWDAYENQIRNTTAVSVKQGYTERSSAKGGSKTWEHFSDGTTATNFAWLRGWSRRKFQGPLTTGEHGALSNRHANAAAPRENCKFITEMTTGRMTILPTTKRYALIVMERTTVQGEDSYSLQGGRSTPDYSRIFGLPAVRRFRTVPLKSKKSSIQFSTAVVNFNQQTKRLKALGNAVVPACAQWIGERIMEMDRR